MRPGAWTGLALAAAIAALPPVGLWPAAFVTWAALLAAVAAGGAASAALSGATFLGGIGAYAFLGALSYGPATYAGGVALLGVLGAAFALWSRHALRLPLLRAAITVAGAWCAVELVAGRLFDVPLYGALLLEGLARPPALLRILGPHGLAFVLVAAQAAAVAAMAGALADGRRRARTAAGAVAAGVTLAALPAGATAPPAGPALRAAVVQTALPGWRYREPGLAAARRAYNDAVARLGERAAASGPELAVWPELGYAGYPFRVHPSLADRLPKAQSHLLTVPDLDPAGRERLAAFLVGPGGEVRGVQGKARQVRWIERGAPAPARHAPLTDALARPGVLVCLEATLAERVRALAAGGAGWLVATSSEAYAGPSWLAHMAAGLARLHAAAAGLPLVRAANGGPSLVTDGSGAVRLRIGAYREAVRPAAIAAGRPTLYARAPVDPGLLLAPLVLAGLGRPRAAGGRAPRRARAATQLVVPLAVLAAGIAAQWWLAREALARAGTPAPAGHLLAGHARAARAASAPPAFRPERAALAFLLRRYGVEAPRVSGDPRERERSLHAHGLAPLAVPEAGAFLPALHRLRDGRAVVLLEHAGGAFRAWDPAAGRMRTVGADALARGPGLGLRTGPRWWDTP